MMSTNGRKVFAMAFVLVALMSIFVPVASADVGSQTWFLTTGSPGLDKTYPTDSSKDCASNTWHGWNAEYAQCDLTMPAGTWTLDLDYNAEKAGYIDVSVTDGTEYLVNGHRIYLGSGAGTLKEEMTGVTRDFNTATSDRLKLVIHWVCNDPPGTLTIYYGDGKSRLASPSTDPGYPVPEMSTLALFSVGLLALVGYVAYRRRGR